MKNTKIPDMKVYALRLTKEKDLKQELINFTQENNIKADFIITCVGCVKRATLRVAGGKVLKDFDKKHEILSLTGTLCQDDVHLHLCISDIEGNAYGGHLKEGCIIDTTAEIIIGEAEDYTFTRKFDENTEYAELIIDKA